MTLTPPGLRAPSASTKDTVEPDTVGTAPAPRWTVTRTLLRQPAAVACLGYIALVLLMALFAPLIVRLGGWDPYTFDQTAIDPDLGGVPLGPWGGISGSHWLGVEPGTGRDTFARIVYGARSSMLIALSATLLTSALGILFGLLAGYFGGRVDMLVSRLMEFLMAFPALIFMIAVLSALPADDRQYLLVVVIALFGWPYLARIVRAQTLSLKEHEFVEAARASGASRTAIVFTEILPNLRSTVLVMVTLAVPGYIGTEAGLSFLGVGVVPPTPSWGQMIASSVTWYSVVPAYFLVPGTFLALLVLSFMVLGDRVRAAVEPGGRR